MLDNSAYAGIRRYRGETFAANWTPLVSPELFERARATRIKRRSFHGSPSGRPSCLLSGLLVCGVCGSNLHRNSGKDLRQYRCRTGEDQLQACLGGSITGAIAEELVVDAWVELLSLVKDRAFAKRGATLKEQWDGAPMAARRKLLREVIRHVELVPRPLGNRHGRGRRMGRQLRIHWDDAWGHACFGYRGATSLISRHDPHATSARGKSWRQWRQLRLMGPERT